MRVAIAGGGSLTRYLSEELPALGHEVIILTRSTKPFFDGKKNVSQRVTDYSETALVEQLDDCDVLISTILDYTAEFVRVNLALIEACRKSTKCKRFIPSEYVGNSKDFPDQPIFYRATREPVRKVLREQNEIEWTVVCVGWFTDYLLPRENRYLSDMGSRYPIYFDIKKATIPGTGKERVTMTSARDTAKAMGLLLDAPKWNRYVYMEGESTTWLEVAQMMKERMPELAIELRSLTQLIQSMVDQRSDEEVREAENHIYSASGAAGLDSELVKSDRAVFFKDMNFRTCREVIDEADKYPDRVV